eukprot:1533945-Rhodomonas_salina.2
MRRESDGFVSVYRPMQLRSSAFCPASSIAPRAAQTEALSFGPCYTQTDLLVTAQCTGDRTDSGYCSSRSPRRSAWTCPPSPTTTAALSTSSRASPSSVPLSCRPSSWLDTSLADTTP